MIKVIARKGIRVPVEGRPDRYVTDSEPVDVPATAYWHRRLKDGDLLIYTEKTPPAEPGGAPDNTQAADASSVEKKPAKSAAPAAKAAK